MPLRPRHIVTRRLRRCVLTLLALIALCCVAGCQMVNQDRVQDADADSMPWNSRAGWEGSGMGVPY
jgi:hypothetical protein